MKASTIAATAALLICSTSARAVSKRQTGGTVGAIDSVAIKNAVLAWQSDTGAVSNFLNFGVDNAAANADDIDGTFRTEASSAHGSEVDELNHKLILDQQLCAGGQSISNPVCGTICSPDANGVEQCSTALHDANDTLVAQGTFQSVVDLLQDMADNGFAQNGDISEINNGHDGIGGRCNAVLPAIDTYFAQAAALLVSEFNDHSIDGMTAVRPAACSSS